MAIKSVRGKTKYLACIAMSDRENYSKMDGGREGVRCWRDI